MKAKALFTSSDVARFCDADVKTIHNWANAGKLAHFYTPGRHLRFRPEDVRQFLERQGFPVPPLVQLSAPGLCSRGILLATEGATVTHVVLLPGERRPEEVHIAQRKRIVALLGSVHVRTGPESINVQEVCGGVDFSVGIVSAHVAHTIENRGPERAEYISILRPENP